MSRIDNTVSERQTPADKAMRQEHRRVTGTAGEQVDASEPKVAIVHDWLVGGGAELVVEQLHKMYPDAPIYTSMVTEEWQEKLGGKVITSYMQKWPLNKMRKFLPVLRARWFSHLNLPEYDLVISSSGAEAKGVSTTPNTLHVNYCHAPTHYYWSRYDQYIENPGFGLFNPIARLGLKLLLSPMRAWDKKAALQPDFIIANSAYIQKEIKKYYGRDSDVIYPPVNTNKFNKNLKQERSGIVALGRQTAYKKIDLAVKACSELNLPLKIIGDGPEHSKLKAIAGESVDFLGYIPPEQKVDVLQQSEAMLFPGVDDFGISAVEALAAGTPVIAYKKGGALDYVVPGKTGEFFEQQTAESLAQALEKFDASKYNHKEISKFAEKFSEKEFQTKMRKFLEEKLAKYSLE